MNFFSLASEIEDEAKEEEEEEEDMVRRDFEERICDKIIKNRLNGGHNYKVLVQTDQLLQSVLKHNSFAQ